MTLTYELSLVLETVKQKHENKQINIEHFIVAVYDTNFMLAFIYIESKAYAIIITHKR